MQSFYFSGCFKLSGKLWVHVSFFFCVCCDKMNLLDYCKLFSSPKMWFILKPCIHRQKATCWHLKTKWDGICLKLCWKLYTKHMNCIYFCAWHFLKFWMRINFEMTATYVSNDCSKHFSRIAYEIVLLNKTSSCIVCKMEMPTFNIWTDYSFSR